MLLFIVHEFSIQVLGKIEGNVQERVRDLFTQLDDDNTGTVSVEDLAHRVLPRTGVRPRDAWFIAWGMSLDLEDQVGYTEFMAAVCSLRILSSRPRIWSRLCA